MEYRRLHYILTIAKEKSISHAAKKLYISQPSLSQYLQKVEQEIGSPLFDRSIQPLRPTYVGKLYLQKARQILDIERQFQQEIDDVLQLKRGEITIGSSPFRSTYLLSGFLPLFKQIYQHIKIKLKESTTLHLEKLAFNGEIDIAISLLPIDSQKFLHENLFEEELWLVIPKEHPIAKQYSLKPGNYVNLPEVSLNEFVNEAFIIVNHKQKLHKMTFELCKKAGFNPKIILQTKSMNTAHALAGAGVGITLLPNTLIHNLHTQNMPCYLQLKDRPKRTANIIWRKDRYVSIATQKFILCLKDYCKKNF